MASSGFAPPINTSIFIPEVDWQESIHKARPPPRIENFNFAKSAIHSVSRFLIPCHMPFWDWQHKTLYFTLNTFDSMLQKTGSQFFFDAVSRGLTWDRPAKYRSGTASCKHAVTELKIDNNTCAFIFSATFWFLFLLLLFC